MPDPWSWKTVFETLLGTGVGACVGVGGIWWQTREQNRSAYEIRLTSSLFEAAENFNTILTGVEIREKWRLIGLDSQSLRFKNIAMLCHEEDQKLLLLLADICFELAPKSFTSRSHMITQMMGTITGWRSGLMERDVYLNSAEKMLTITKDYKTQIAPRRRLGP